VIFPRPIKKFSNGCIALIATHRSRSDLGEPILKNNYNTITYNNKSWATHRLSFHLNVRKIKRRPGGSKGKLILHTCHHKWCINFEHLYQGRQLQNMIDRWSAPGNEESRASISKKLKGRIVSLEHRRSIAEHNRRRIVSKKTREKMSASFKGRIPWNKGISQKKGNSK